MCDWKEQSAASLEFEEAMAGVVVPQWESARTRELVPFGDDDDFWSEAFEEREGLV